LWNKHDSYHIESFVFITSARGACPAGAIKVLFSDPGVESSEETDDPAAEKGKFRASEPIKRRAMNRCAVTLITFSLLAACTTAPPSPLATDNPASPSAPEAPLGVTHNSLGTDGLTKKTRQILAQTAEDQQSDQSGASGQKEQEMKNMPYMQQPMSGMPMPEGQSQPSAAPNN
jgi:hypothetical protein